MLRNGSCRRLCPIHVRMSNVAAFDKAAQNMSDRLSSKVFDRLLKQQLQLAKPIAPQMFARIRLLQQIPFRAILSEALIARCCLQTCICISC